MRVDVVHTTRLEYAAEVVEGVTEARLGPRSDADQSCLRFELRTAPGASVNQFVDGFGNVTHLITFATPHRFMEIVTRSSIQTLLVDPFRVPDVPITPLTPAELADYLPPSRLVPALPGLQLLAGMFQPGTPEDTFNSVVSMSELTYRRLEYASQVTTVATTVADVLQQRRGVCQDFAHLLIGLCRAIDIPARYVSGYIVVDPDRRPVGARSAMGMASHAWVEAFTPSHGWRGFDPTNNVLASEQHVKMAVGRDYADVPPTRGTYRGDGAETLSVHVETRASAPQPIHHQQ
jgi:transglutaminase-like putative cysteine protease